MGGDEEKESWSGGSNVYSQGFFVPLRVCTRTAAINVKRASVLDLISLNARLD